MKENKNNAQENKEIEEKRKNIIEGLKFIALGAALIMLSLLLHMAHIIETHNKVLLFLNELWVQIFSHFGIGCLAIGVLTIILDMQHWTNYFETRLSKIVINKNYLHKLSPKDLMQLQTEVLKVYFKNDQIDGEESFLQYCQKNIHSIIGMPYRVNVMMNLKIKECIYNSELIEIFETMSYHCINNGDNLQEHICYIPDEGEHEKTNDFSVVLQHDDFINNKGDHKGRITFDLDKLMDLGACKNVKNGFNLFIKDYNRKGLQVIQKVNYLINKNRFMGWRMSHPTYRLTMTVDFPVDFNLEKEFFFNEKNVHSEDLDNTNGTYILSINDWLLPDEGVTLQLVKKNRSHEEILPDELSLVATA